MPSHISSPAPLVSPVKSLRRTLLAGFHTKPKIQAAPNLRSKQLTRTRVTAHRSRQARWEQATAWKQAPRDIRYNPPPSETFDQHATERRTSRVAQAAPLPATGWDFPRSFSMTIVQKRKEIGQDISRCGWTPDAAAQGSRRCQPHKVAGKFPLRPCSRPG